MDQLENKKSNENIHWNKMCWWTSGNIRFQRCHLKFSACQRHLGIFPLIYPTAAHHFLLMFCILPPKWCLWTSSGALGGLEEVNRFICDKLVAENSPNVHWLQFPWLNGFLQLPFKKHLNVICRYEMPKVFKSVAAF